VLLFLSTVSFLFTTPGVAVASAGGFPVLSVLPGQFLIKDVVRQLSPADFLAVRFVIAAVLMSVVFWRPLRALTRRQVRLGVVLGVLYAVAQLLQTVGLAHTEASRSGFITGTYVVLTPVFTAVLLRERLPRSTWAAVGLASLALVPPAWRRSRLALRVVEHLPREVSELRHGGQANAEPEPPARLGLTREAVTEASEHGAAEDRLEKAAAHVSEVRRDPRLVAGHSPGLVHQPNQLAQPVDVHAGHHDRLRWRRTDRRAGHPGGQARCDPLQDDLEVVVCESFHGTPR